jgi:hypothetical protein
MPLERDIVEKIKQTFLPEDAARAIELLSMADKSGRVARCIVFAASGNLKKLKSYLQLADQDYRDVIVAGEYQETHRHLRDFRVSFLIDSPLKWWISEVAAALARRDYFLSSVETVPVNNAVTKYHSDLGEGTATFEGDLGQVCVTKNQGQWVLKGNAAELELYGLTKAFDNARDFSDAVSGYILSRRRPGRQVGR